MSNTVFTSKKFLPLFIVQFAGLFNDNLLKNALLVLITFSDFSLFGLKHAQIANLIVACFIIPTIIFSSSAGKLADSVDKVKIIRIVKILELVLFIIAGVGFYFQNSILLILALISIGITAAYILPIRYSILPQYLPKDQIIMASGYMEMGVFTAVLFGQASGSLLMAAYDAVGVMIVLLFFAILSLYFSYKMESAPPTNDHISFSKNIIADNYHMYKLVTQNSLIKKNVHSIGWFLAMGIIVLTQLPFLTLNYLGGDAKVLALCGALLSIGIGVGSLSCAKISNGVIIHKYVILGALGWALSIFLLLALNHQLSEVTLNFEQYIRTNRGILSLILVFLIGFSSGFYSLTCYSELPIISPSEIRAQVTATSNLMGALYQICVVIISFMLLHFNFTSWGLMLSVGCLNILFAIWYAVKK